MYIINTIIMVKINILCIPLLEIYFLNVSYVFKLLAPEYKLCI